MPERMTGTDGSVRGPEPRGAEHAVRLNWLRAGVLGANDGIVSVAALLVGVAAAANEIGALLIAGVASLTAGAVSMALGEYVSVSTQRDTERALVEREREELRTMPAQELAELARLYEAKGLSRDTAEAVARELTEHDALAAHLEAELHMGEQELANPWVAAGASAAAFALGAVLPLTAALLAPTAWRVPAVFASVVIALALTGFASARLGAAPPRRAVLRVVAGGVLGMVASYAIGGLLGTAVA